MLLSIQNSSDEVSFKKSGLKLKTNSSHELPSQLLGAEIPL